VKLGDSDSSSSLFTFPQINAFYLQKEAELKVRLRTLIDKRKLIMSRRGSGKLSKESPAFYALYEGFRYFEKDLSKLQQFIEINATGFRKILKKWDKRSKSQTKELYLARQVEVQRE
jgi:CDK inhibitor PHO81